MSSHTGYEKKILLNQIIIKYTGQENPAINF